MHWLLFICFVAWHVEDSSANLFEGFFKWNKYSWPSGNQSATVRPTLPTPRPLGNATAPNRWNGGGSGRGRGPLPPTSNIPAPGPTMQDQCLQSLEILLDSVFKDIKRDMGNTQKTEAWNYLGNGLRSDVIPKVERGPKNFPLPSSREIRVFGKDVLCDINTVKDVRRYAVHLISIYGDDGIKWL